ncbi:hypothetical protein [Desulfoluna butyratoxydans]|uniref:Uncharacterized protein n=1 Tax=Desulfoluna butyratoxydans TaxID=231438 RepID=A0A4U8YHQ6_9BACT|nr:hypothetical protein [Desulfoluna butyratoxydans]VFQ42767.1 hypothetical protein MSL71_3880 [Desulfoluna butyratoxydans]
MRTFKGITFHIVTVTVVMVAFSFSSGPAVAGLFDFTKGTVAQPGTELHELGTQALMSGLDGISYFTNGEGNVMKVQAKEMSNGDLRVAVNKVHIPRDYVSENTEQVMEAEQTLKELDVLADKQPWIGGYAVLPHDEGVKAYQTGVMVENERRRSATGAYDNNRSDCCWGF